MIEVELVSFNRCNIDEHDIDAGQLEFLEFFGRADEIQCFQDMKGFGETICEFLQIDYKSDWEHEGMNVEWDYFILTKERALDLVKKLSTVSLKYMECRGFVIDILNKIIKDFDFEEEILAITVGEQ